MVSYGNLANKALIFYEPYEAFMLGTDEYYILFCCFETIYEMRDLDNMLMLPKRSNMK